MNPQERMIREELDARLDRAWSGMLSTDDGRFIVHDLLTRICGIYQSTFTGNNHGIHLEGRRSVGLEVLQSYVITHGSSLHGQMMIEADEREKMIAAAIAADREDRDAD